MLLGSFDGKLAVQFRRNPEQEFSGIRTISNSFGRSLAGGQHVLHNLCDELLDAVKGLRPVAVKPRQ